MDTSKEYIKMADCPEIQELGFEEVNGFIDEKYWSSVYICGGCLMQMSEDCGYYFCGCGKKSDKTIWLPRIDKLQEMSDWSWNCFDILCAENALEYAIQEEPTVDKKMLEDSFWQLCSKEIAGLLTLMKEKHNKTWHEETWEEILDTVER